MRTPRSATVRFLSLASLVLAGALLAAPAAATADDLLPSPSLPRPVRLAGADRYEQAILAAKAGFTSSDVVFVASGEKFPDALSAVSAAANKKAALLLTPGSTLLPAVGDEIAALHPDAIVVVGGPASVSDAVLDQLSRRVVHAAVVRIGGADRYEVSRNLISDPVFGFNPGEIVYLANGGGFADALTASPAAAGSGSYAHPVLLVNGAQAAPTAEETALITSLEFDEVYTVGGSNSISDALDLFYHHDRVFLGQRLGGVDRFEVGVTVNQSVFSSARTVYLASGLTFPDALSGGALAAHDKSPLYVVQQNCVPWNVLHDIERLHPDKIVVLGGTATLGAGVESLTGCPVVP